MRSLFVICLFASLAFATSSSEDSSSASSPSTQNSTEVLAEDNHVEEVSYSEEELSALSQLLYKTFDERQESQEEEEPGKHEDEVNDYYSSDSDEPEQVIMHILKNRPIRKL